jgi:hypothetical protein
MNGNEKTVTSAKALLAAIREPGIERILVSGRLIGASPISLSPGQSLFGVDDSAAIAFEPALTALNCPQTTLSATSIFSRPAKSVRSSTIPRCRR